MRLNGTIKSWDDERGFGFIAPDQGGQDIFVHIKSFEGLRERPKAGQRISFQVQLNTQGKTRAINVALAKPLQSHVRRSSRTRWDTATLLTIPAFGLVLMLGYLVGHPPRWLLWLYLGASFLTFIAYAIDKSAAQKGKWRTSEQTLHLLALGCGWPGAMLAQQMLRHKSSKQEFRSVFWLTVGLNVCGFIFIASPYAQKIIGLRALATAA